MNTFAIGPNNPGLICRSYSPSLVGSTASSTMAKVIPNTMSLAWTRLICFSVNDAGDFVGYSYSNSTQAVTGFASIDGLVIVIEISGMTTVLPSGDMS